MNASRWERSLRFRYWKQGLGGVGVFLLLYLLLAYVLMPWDWLRYEGRHAVLDDLPTITRTGDNIPGDPLNVGMVGTEKELKLLMVAARWYPADPLTLRSCLEIAEATVLKRPYDEAPVSNLFLFGRKEDLAFEQPVGNDPRKRHHVRFWRTEAKDGDGRTVWLGGATFDKRVGFSHTTGQITHHIDGNVDAERDHVLQTCQETGRLAEIYDVADFQKVKEGKNGGGDRWQTDGKLRVGVIKGEN